MAKHTIEYQNNPFFIGLNGLQLLFKRAQSVGIYAAILAGVGLLANTTSNIIDSLNRMNKPDISTSSKAIEISTTPNSFDIGILVVALAFVLFIAILSMLISALLYGVLEYTSAGLARDKNVTLGEAFAATFKKLPGYVWVYIVMVVKVFLWTLLLIVPGIIMAVRYSLAGTVYFAEDKRGNAAVKRSAELTKGAWFTTFAGTGLWNLMTFGIITWLVNPSANAILYRQYKDVTDSGTNKPSAHWLSWLTFFGPIALFMIFFGFVIFLVLLVWIASR